VDRLGAGLRREVRARLAESRRVLSSALGRVADNIDEIKKELDMADDNGRGTV